MATPLQNHLRALREAQGLTLEQLASAVGTTNQQISHLELGKRQLTVAWLERLARALGCHPWAIVDGDTGASQLDADLTGRIRKLPPAERAALLRTLQRLEGHPTTAMTTKRRGP